MTRVEAPGATASAVAGFEPLDAPRIAARLRATDPDLGEVIEDPDSGTVSVIAARGDGLDIAIGPTLVTISADLVGLKPQAAEALFTRLLDVLTILRAEFAMRFWLPAAARPADPDEDHEALARAWLACARAGASEHLARLGERRHLPLVALALLTAFVAAAASLPSAQALVTAGLALFAAPLAGLLLWRRLRRGRD